MIDPIAYGRTEGLGGTEKSKNGVDPRLKPAAHEFEAQMLQELLSPLKHDSLFSNSNSGGVGLASGDAGTGTWSSLGIEALARAISDAGGLGIADKVIHDVEAQSQAGAQKPSPGVARKQSPPQASASAGKLLSGLKGRH